MTKSLPMSALRNYNNVFVKVYKPAIWQSEPNQIVLPSPQTPL